MQRGDRVQVKAYKADGTLYRWWTAAVELAGDGELVLINPAGHRVEEPSGGWVSRWAIRSYYWPGRSYSLMEVYLPEAGQPQCRLVEIYVNINSPVEIGQQEIRFTDYELDVSREPPHGARIVDQDEFAEAAARYGYSPTFQEACYRTAREAVELADRWVARGMSQQ